MECLSALRRVHRGVHETEGNFRALDEDRGYAIGIAEAGQQHGDPVVAERLHGGRDAIVAQLLFHHLERLHRQ